MSLTGAVIIYILVWWSVFFMLLPTRIKSVWEEEGEREKGIEEGAPVNPGLRQKAIKTTWVSAIVSAIIIAVIKSGVISYT